MFLSRGQKTTLPSVLPCDISPLSHSSGINWKQLQERNRWSVLHYASESSGFIQVSTQQFHGTESAAVWHCSPGFLLLLEIHSFIHSSRSHWGIRRYSHSCWGAVWQVGCRRCEWKLPTEFVPDFNLTDLPFVIIFLDISRQFPAPTFRSLFGSSVHTTFSSHSKKKQKNKFAEFVQCKFSFFPITWWRSVSFCVLVQPHWAARVAVVVSPQLPSLFKLWWVDRNV